MNDLRQATEMALNYFEDARGLEDTEVAIKEALRQALAEPEDPRIVELRTLMAEPTVTGVIFEVHRGPLSKSIREFGDCPCPTHVEGDVRIEVKDEEALDRMVAENQRLGLYECAACKKKDELIKLLKEEVGFAERGYTKRNDV